MSVISSPRKSEESAVPLTKRVLVAVLPKRVAEYAKYVKRFYLLFTNSIYDYWRYSKYSSAVFRGNTEEKLRALITIHYHSIEKGLSLAKPRPGFGVLAINTLIEHVQRYLDAYGPAEHLSVPIFALEQYIKFNRHHGLDMSALSVRVERLKSVYTQKLGGVIPAGGALDVTRADILASVAGVGGDFFYKRYSIRQFSGQDVDIDLLKEAVRRAQKSPAVCNRQSGKAWVVSGATQVKRALDIQKGARGFDHLVNKVIIVTSDQCNFQSAGERYQSWIDGGLFAMSLIYGLHSLGLGSCCLNWSMEHARDRELREAFGIPYSETIIMMLAVGHLPEELVVAASVRKPLEEAFVLVD